MNSSESQNTKDKSGALKVIGRYTTAGSIELQGNHQALRDLSKAIISSNPISTLTFLAPHTSSPHPYGGFLTELQISRGKGPVEIELRGSVLLISGSRATLEVLADDIEWLLNETDTTLREDEGHLHIEYYPDHPYLAPSSISLVVVAQEVQV